MSVEQKNSIFAILTHLLPEFPVVEALVHRRTTQIEPGFAREIFDGFAGRHFIWSRRIHDWSVSKNLSVKLTFMSVMSRIC